MNGGEAGAGARRLAPLLDGGLPLLGHAYDMWRRPVDLLARGHQRHGDVFRLRLAGKTATVLLGPRAHHAFFHAPSSILSPRECYQFTVPVFGPGVAYDVAEEVMDQQLAWVHPAFSEKRLRTYAQRMADEARALTCAWGAGGEIDLFDVMNELTTYIATRCLLGEDVRQHLTAEFAQLYHDLDGGMNLMAFFAPHAPLPAFRRRDRARVQVAALLGRVMAERRAHPERGPYEDFLQTLMEARYQDGSAVPDEVIVGLLLTLIFAGQHTSAVLGSWTGILLHQNLAERAAVVRELDETFDAGGEITREGLQRCGRLERAVMEAERLRPPLIMLMRAVLTDFEHEGFVLPAGTLAMVSPAVAHRLSSVFRDPQRYDPDRFAPGREEHKHTQYTLIGFGGGKHRCLGFVFAYQQVKLIWATLLREFEFELIEPDYAPNYSTFVVGPRQPARVRYRRRRAGATSAAATRQSVA